MKWLSPPCSEAMASSDGIFLFILLVQVFTATECASSPDDVDQFSPGFRLPRSNPPNQNSGRKHLPFSYSQHKPLETTVSEDDLTCLVGTDLEVPYPLYKQISDSFLSTNNILVLLPNNTIVQVTGYAGLKDVAQVDPDDTKVLISPEMMIPAAIYLRIVLIRPEEVMIRLPDGQILPNQIYQELYGPTKLQTQDQGGQTYFGTVSAKDSFPFLVFNDHKKRSSTGKPPNTFTLENDIPSSGKVESESFNKLLQDESPSFPEPMPGSEPVPIPDYLRSKRGQRYPEVMHVPHYSTPSTLHYSNFYPEQTPVLHFPYYPEPISAPRPHRARTTHQHHAEPTKPACEKKALLPPGIHVMDTSRCNICDPDSPGPHIKVITV